MCHVCLQDSIGFVLNSLTWKKNRRCWLTEWGLTAGQSQWRGDSAASFATSRCWEHKYESLKTNFESLLFSAAFSLRLCLHWTKQYLCTHLCIKHCLFAQCWITHTHTHTEYWLQVAPPPSQNAKSLLPEEDKSFLLPDKHHRGVGVIYNMKETHLLLFDSAHIDLKSLERYLSALEKKNIAPHPKWRNSLLRSQMKSNVCAQQSTSAMFKFNGKLDIAIIVLCHFRPKCCICSYCILFFFFLQLCL